MKIAQAKVGSNMATKNETSPVAKLKAATARMAAVSARFHACAAALERGDRTDAEREEATAVLTEHKAATRAVNSALRALGL